MFEIPNDYKSERWLLACFLMENDLIATTSLESRHFYSASNRDIFASCIDLYKNRMTVDLVSLTSRWHDEEDVINLSTELLTVSWFHTYEKIIEELYFYRQTISEIDKLKALCYDKSWLDTIQSKIWSMSAIGINTEQDWHDLSEVISDYLDDDNKSTEPIANYGYTLVDDTTKWLKPGQLVVIWAWPWTWKSLFSINILDNILRQWVNCALFSLEMTKQEIAERFFAMWSWINIWEIPKTDQTKIMKSIPSYMDNKWLFIYDKTFSFWRILANIRKLFIQDNVKVFVIDYLQLMKTSWSKLSKNDEIGKMTRELKIVAMELWVNVILLSQLNRQWQKAGQKPTNASLRDSWNIEQDANVVMLMHRDDHDPCFELIVSKNRNWKSWTVVIEVDYATMKVTWERSIY